MMADGTDRVKITQNVLDYIALQGWGEIQNTQPVGGGCINNAQRLTTTSGIGLLLKQNPSAPPDMFEREAEGLRALAVEAGPRVPTPFLAGRDFLLTEYLAPAPPAADYWETFGQRLARLHHHTSARFGFPHDNYIGSTPQPNGWLDDGFEFFAERRLLFQGRLARERGWLSPALHQKLERAAARLREWIPAQPASLIHGDLWGGNVIVGPEGHACLIDPAAHYGWAEAELAMTALFGRFPEAFYSAYVTVRPLEAGYRSRFDSYNLYHLLNHLNLFGASYLGAVETTLRRYG
jgi:fructosamine-3-kinase